MEMTFNCGGYTQEQFTAMVNNWFMQHQNIIVRKMYMSDKTSFGFFVNKSNVTNMTIIYDIDDSVKNHYGFTVYEKFSLIKTSMESMQKSWLEANPDFSIVCSNYHYNMRGEAGSILLNGFMAANRLQLRVIYKFNPQAAQHVPPVSQQPPVTQQQPVGQSNFCAGCGSPVISGAKFCANCGNKII